MSYRINPLQNPEFEFRRLMTENTGKAFSVLHTPSLSFDEKIHDFRTDMKKVRAVLRLMRFNLGDETYRSENAFYRKLQHEPAILRDSDIRRTTLESLMQGARYKLNLRIFDRYYAELHNNYLRLKEQFDSADILDQLGQSLKKHDQNIQSLCFTAHTLEGIEQGLKKIFKQGKKAMETAREDPSPENMHEWRKKTKYLWYHIELLREIWPSLMKSLAESMHSLSDLLGEEHDLSVLISELNKGPYKEENTLSQVTGLAEAKKKDLQVESFLLGAKIYFESPGRFSRRIMAYWREETGERAGN